MALLDWPRMNKEAAELLQRFAVDIDVRRPLMDFSTAIQQMVAIARAVSFKAKLVIMDEPTSSLDEREVAVLFDVMRQLRREGVAVIFVSHRLDELFEVCDRVTIMRDGRTALTQPHGRHRQAAPGVGMLGRDLESVRKSGATGFTEAATSAGAEIMAAEGLPNRPARARRASRSAGAARSSVSPGCSAPAARKPRARFSAPIRQTRA